MIISGGVGAYTVIWSDGSSELILEDLLPGVYDVEILDENGCSTMGTFEVGGTTNVNDIPSLQAFDISPNPASDFINLQLTLNELSNLSLEIYTSMGQLIYTEKYQSQIVKDRIDVSSWDTGVYFVKIRKDDKVAVKRVFISN